MRGYQKDITGSAMMTIVKYRLHYEFTKPMSCLAISGGYAPPPPPPPLYTEPVVIQW